MSRSGRTQAPDAHREGLTSRIGKRAPRGRADAVRALAEAWTRRLPSDELARHEEAIAGQILGAFSLIDGREAGEVAVRAFNPDPERDGYGTPGSVLETNCVDSPFIFDSVNAELAARDLVVLRVIHPVVGVERDARGRVARILHARDASDRESVMHFEVDERLDDDALADLAQAVRGVLADVALAVRDFDPMRARVEDMIGAARQASHRYAADEVDETVAFLRWLLDLNFVFLGYREYDLVDGPHGRALALRHGSGLGILAKEDWSAYREAVPLAEIEPTLRARIEDGDLLIYSKTNRLSTVHRRARMDYVGIRRIDAGGRVVGEARLVGLFTSKAYMEPASRTPLLARKLARIVEAEDLFEGSHDHKSVVSIFESFPKDELFAADADALRERVMGLLASQDQQHLRLFVRTDIPSRSVAVLVAMPRERFDADLQRRLETYLRDRYRGASVDVSLSLGEGPSARLHFTVHVPQGQIPDVPLAELEREVEDLSRTWEDLLLARLQATLGPDVGRARFERWIDTLPESYRATTPVEVACVDIERCEELDADPEGLVVGLLEVPGGERLTRLRLYRRGAKLALSEVVPMLEDLGLRVVEESTTRIGHRSERHLHDFGVLGADGEPLDLAACGDRIAECLRAVWRGDAESDSLNRLVISAGLGWRDVDLLRAYRKYHHRVNAGFPVEYKNDAYAAHPSVAADLVELFGLRFDPARRSDAASADAAAASLRDSIVRRLDAIRSLEQDRILRAALGLVEATVRTNAFRPGRTSLSFKLRSADVPDMPRPVPLYEIFVYSTGTEAIHLRFGRVSRGGIRWSDRRQDYRSEILALMKAQTVKNAVIVPTGAKGGFILKRPPSDPDALREEVREQYSVFMRGMLDITDNLVDGAVVHPRDVVVHDDADPYLVVAADKGTATLSDTANAIAAEYGYWLGDAFASGGSSGYDHKALGITARGAWESVKQHFRQMGVDATHQQITVVGIGDMSGDVFGNGMLRSEHLRLVAAFDHRHVFLDPDPDPAASFAERRRLFDLPRSSWDDYDRSVISAGGGVWPRTEKQIPLTEPMRRVLDVTEESMSPDALIGAILRAPVDLLWNGGIGTWVKASDESHADADDRINDGLRVDGRDLRARVVAEGGNLGFTQRGRIEFAQRGGRINTDFIDNSAGVDCSDHEVNLKVLLGTAVAARRLTLEERDRLLREVEPDVTRHVLYDNFLQAQILGQSAERSAARLESLEELMQTLEADGLLDRVLESLPSSEEMSERRRDGAGMTRPELAILLAWTKQRLAQRLLASTLPDSEYLAQDLRAYFPPAVTERFGDLIGQHPLRRELIATIVANDVVNSQGVTFVSRLATETGADEAEIVRAYRIARDLTGAGARWDAIEGLAGDLPTAVLDDLLTGIDRLVESLSRWYLTFEPDRLGRAIADGRDAFARLVEILPTVAPEDQRARIAAEHERLVASGVPHDVALRHAEQRLLVHAPNIIAVSGSTGRALEDVARAFLMVGGIAHLDRLHERLEQVPTPTRWHRWALQALQEDLLLARRRIVEHVLGIDGSASLGDLLATFVASRSGELAAAERSLRATPVEEGEDLAAASIAVRQIEGLVSR